MSPRRIAHLLLVLLLCPGLAAAWSERGHRLVAMLAEQELSPQARAAVAELLRDEPEPTLAGVSTWGDAMRDTRPLAWTAPLHYVYIRDRSCRFDARRDCAEGHCVVGAIARYARRLGDRSLARDERIQALKFVVHFVGDVHQPLHSGRRRDRGGNDFQISVATAASAPIGSSLHGVWDYFILAEAGERIEQHAKRLRFAGLPVAGEIFEPAEAVRWAQTSCALTDAEGFYPRRPGRLPPGYLERMRPLAERRLREAAAELALLLEGALGAPEATPLDSR